MKPKFLIGCLLVTILSACSNLGRNEQVSSSPRANEIRTALTRSVIPEIDLENVTAEEALRVWSQKSQTYHPLHFKFQAVVSYPMTFTKGKSATQVMQPATAKVTVRRRNITSKRLLDEICHQANLVWRITGRVIVVQPGTARADRQP